MRKPDWERLKREIQSEVALFREQWLSLCVMAVLGFLVFAIYLVGIATLDVIFSVLNMVGQILWGSPEAVIVISFCAGYIVWRLAPDFRVPPK